MSAITGWGRGTWSEGTFGEPLPVLVSGVFASGEVGGIPQVVVNLTGVSASGEVGTVSLSTDQVVSVNGVESSTIVGEVTQKTNQRISVAGLVAQSRVGLATATGDANVFVTGLQGSIATPRVLVWGKVIPDPSNTWTEIAA
jgi:hypothetical protein